jgi:prepilin peptidase CpaA
VLGYALILIFPIAMAFAAAMDLLTMTIPNRISLVLIAAFAAAVPFADVTWADLALKHVGIGAAVLAVGIGLFSLGWMGGGDVKLMASAALWLGYDHLGTFLFGVSLLGGLLALAVLVYRRYVPEALVASSVWAARLHKQGGGIPYGIAIAGAALAVYPSTQWFVSMMS